MIAPNPKARVAAIGLAALSALGLAAGVALTVMLGGTTGQDLGRNAADAAFARATPLLVLAEIVKLLSAAAQVVVVRAVSAAAPPGRARLASLVSGIAGALLIAASGIVGLYAVATAQPDLGPIVADLGFAGVAATGVFAIVLVSFEAPRLRRWHVSAALLFAIASLAGLILPPLVLLTVPLGWAFWLGLARRFAPR